MDEAERQQMKAPEGEPGLQINLAEHFGMLRKHLLMVAAVFATGMMIGGGYLYRQPKIYRSTGTLHIDTITPQVLGNVKEVVDLGASDYWSNKEFYETQYRIISSRDVLERVVEQKALDRDASFLGLDRIPDPAKRAEAVAAADAVAVLQARLHVDPVKNSQLVEVSIEDGDPQRATDLANAVMAAYIERNLDRRLEGSKAASNWLTEQMASLKGKLESSELALYDFKKDHDILSASLEDRQNITSQRLVALNENLTKVMAHRAELESAVAQADLEKKSHPDDRLWALNVPTVAESLVINNLRGDLSQQQREVAALTNRYGDKHPSRIAAEERADEVRDRLATESARMIETLRSEFHAAASTEQHLRELIEGTKREAFEINKKEIDFKKLSRESDNNQRLYDLVLTRLKEADLTSLLKANNVRQLEAAQVPMVPIKPRPGIILLLSFVLSLLSGVGLAYLIELLDRTLKGEEDLERALGIPFLGMIPSVSAGLRKREREDDPTRDLWVFKNPKSAAAECCRAIRTNLLFMSPDRELRRIVVTSSGPQEGKTTTCINVGVAMAQAGSRVLLVDTDMRRPRLHRAFKVSSEVGLSNLIVGESEVSSAVKTTDVPNLWVLPCGPLPPNPAELLHTDRFKALIDELSQRYDRVIFDTPPLVAVADAAVLATVSDGVMLVTRFRKTTRDVARHVVRNLRDVNATLLGAVMNDVNLESREYGYYYYRRYGYYEPGESPGT